MNHSGNDDRSAQRAQADADADADPNAEVDAQRERRQPGVSRPGGFQNDPDDPTNPNEAIDRTRRSSLNPRRDRGDGRAPEHGRGREDDGAR